MIDRNFNLVSMIMKDEKEYSYLKVDFLAELGSIMVGMEDEFKNKDYKNVLDKINSELFLLTTRVELEDITPRKFLLVNKQFAKDNEIFVDENHDQAEKFFNFRLRFLKRPRIYFYFSILDENDTNFVRKKIYG